jgi:hypothetical protein
MKTLANAQDKEEIERRLRTIRPNSQRRWGKMTVAEMICHSSDAFRVCMGEKSAKDVSSLFTRTLMKWAALSVPTKWPHGVKTVPECDPRREGSAPSDFGHDMRDLRELLGQFAREPRGFEFQPHPMFGQMTYDEWMRWGYLHMDHHLRQFGA